MSESNDAQLDQSNEALNNGRKPSPKSRQLLVSGLIIVATVFILHDFGYMRTDTGRVSGSTGSNRVLSEYIFYRSSNREEVKRGPVFHFMEWLLLGQDFKQIGNTLWGTAGYCYFGRSLSLSDAGRIMVAGSPDARDNGSQAGKVALFQQQSKTFKFLGEFKGTSGDRLGYSVDVSTDGKWFIAGAPFSSAKAGKAGKVQLFEITGNRATLRKELFGAERNQEFGYSVTMNKDGSRFAVGCPCFNTKYKKGTIRTFENKGGKVKEILNEITGNNNEKLGQSIHISSEKGDVMAVGSPDTNTVTIYSDHKGKWVPKGEPITGKKKDKFGRSVALNEDGSIVAIGTSTGDYVKVYKYNKSKQKWKKYGKTISTKDRFGYSVSLDETGKTLVIGEPYDETNQGFVRVYKYESGKWKKQGKTLSGDDKGVLFGASVVMSPDGHYFAVSSPDAKDPRTGASFCGSVKVYED